MISTLGGWVPHWAQQRPGAPAITFNDHHISWAQLRRRVLRHAAALQRHGVVKGDRVACLLTNRPEYYEVFWACQHLGAIFVPLNTRLAAPELGDILRDARPRVFLSEHSAVLPQQAAVAAALDNGIARILLGPASETTDDDETIEVAPTPCAVDDAAAILYTSGTTGLPKGAIITHGNVMASAKMWLVEFKLTGADRHLIPMPLCFTGGLMAASMHIFCAGGHLVLMESFEPGHALALLERYRITWLVAVPLMLQRMRDDPAWERTDLSALRAIQSGGTAVPAPLIEAYRERDVALMQGYGLTEGTAGSNLYLMPELAVDKAGSIGRSCFSNEARLVADDGQPVSDGEVGELQIRGPLVFSGYWQRPDATRDAFSDGWLNTGDLARRDADGCYFIVGRKKDMIISGGLNVYPAEVERVLDRLPGVVESAVIGVPDAEWGEAVVAVIRHHRGAAPAAIELEIRCREFLAGYKVPKRFAFVDDFPRTVSGKVLKRVLREIYSAA